MRKDLITALKESGQDFEWYPTTRTMIEIIARDIKKIIAADPYDRIKSVLDIGAGNGSFLDILSESIPEENIKKYAIEKSKILVEQMNSDIFVIGTDFYEQTFIDKKMNFIFCNPPYSDYVSWMEKIIQESNCPVLYFIVPSRWRDVKSIAEIISFREAKHKILDTTTFENSEFRAARAKVDIVRIDMGFNGHRNDVRTDPFKLWFKNNFDFDIAKTEDHFADEQTKSEHIKSLINKDDLIDSLVRLFAADMDKLLKNYQAVGQLDATILEELGVNVEALRNSLQMKITGLKNLYWKELFSSLNSVTELLTSKSRQSLMDTLLENVNVDFTQSNIYAVVIWIIKNANKYFDKQLCEVYQMLTSKDNVTLYKSNKRILNDDWRYSRKEWSKYKLDYRIIHEGYQVLIANNWDNTHGLSKIATDLIKDIFTVANNLGFRVIESPEDFQWESRKKITFHYMKNGVKEVFATISAYLKGTIHFKFNQEFMLAFNVEAARLNGWIKSPENAADEMGEKVDDIRAIYRNNRQIGMKDLLQIGMK